MYHNILRSKSAIQNFATAHPSICERIPAAGNQFRGEDHQLPQARLPAGGRRRWHIC